MAMNSVPHVLVLVLLIAQPVFTFIPKHPSRAASSGIRARSLQQRATNKEALFSLEPVFDFSDSARNETDRFERIDDVIMGGISSSTLRQVDGEQFARWSGICREDGGGFCGMRTLPFKNPLEVSDEEGMFLTCRLSSDDEPHRRVWKMSTRSEESRGEQLYQAIMTIPAAAPKQKGKEEWSTIHVPFKEFKLVRGARLVSTKPINTTNGLFQIGMTLSKFSIAENMTSIPDFRPGYFELQIKQIGLYKRGKENAASVSVLSLSKEEALAKRSLLLKLLLPLFKILGTEKSQRRKSAMRLLREERGLSRLRAIRFGLEWRAKQIGAFKSLATTLSILAVDIFRKAFFFPIRYGIFVPLRILIKLVKATGKLFSSGKTESKKEANST